MNANVERTLKELYRKNSRTNLTINWISLGVFTGAVLSTQISNTYGSSVFTPIIDNLILVVLGSLLLLDTVIFKGILWVRNITPDTYNLGRSILTDHNWYLAYTYFYNKRWDDQDVETLVHKGQIIKINRGIEINSDPEQVKFTGTNVNFLTLNEKKFILDVIKARLLRDMVYIDASTSDTTNENINFLKVPYGINYST